MIAGKRTVTVAPNGKERHSVGKLYTLGVAHAVPQMQKDLGSLGNGKRLLTPEDLAQIADRSVRIRHNEKSHTSSSTRGDSSMGS